MLRILKVSPCVFLASLGGGGGVFFWAEEWVVYGHPKSLPPSVAALFVQGPEARSPAADGPWPNWPRLVSWIPSMTISHHLPVSPIDIQSQTWREVNNAGAGPGRPQLVKTSEFTPFDLPSGSKHQVISSVNMIIHDPLVRLGQVFVHVEVDIAWYHPVWDLANMSCAAKMLNK